MGDQFSKEARRLKMRLDDAFAHGDFGNQRAARDNAKKAKKAMKAAKKAEREGDMPMRRAA